MIRDAILRKLFSATVLMKQFAHQEFIRTS
jgi:hypothetical protein